MHGFKKISGTMIHATSWDCKATGEAPSARSAAVGVRSKPVGRCPAGRGGGEFGLSLVAGVPTRGASGAGEQAHAGTAAEAVPAAEAPTRDVAGPGRASGWVPDRALDRRPRDRIDCARVRRAVPPRPRLEGADRVGMELPETRAPRD